MLRLRPTVDLDGAQTELPFLTEGMPPGSLTDYGEDGSTSIILLGIENGQGVIQRSHLGATLENEEIRQLFSADLETVATITPGQNSQIPFRNRFGMTMFLTVRAEEV